MDESLSVRALFCGSRRVCLTTAVVTDVVHGGRPLAALAANFSFECSQCGNSNKWCVAALAMRHDVTDVTSATKVAVTVLRTKRARLRPALVALLVSNLLQRGYVDVVASLARAQPVTVAPHVPALLSKHNCVVSNRASYLLAAAGTRGGVTTPGPEMDIADLERAHRSLMWERWLAKESVPADSFGWRQMLTSGLHRATGRVVPVELCDCIVLIAMSL